MTSPSQKKSSLDEERPLAFAWRGPRGDTGRFALAFAITTLLALLLALTLRVGVPIQFMKDGPLPPSAKLIVVDETSDPTLLKLLEKGRVPSLGSTEILLETPFLEDVLAQYDLAEERSNSLRLYDSPPELVEFSWPEERAFDLVLPDLVEVTLPRPKLATTLGSWVVTFSPSRVGGETLSETWEGELPSTLATTMTLVMAPDGGIALAFPNEDFAPATTRQLRQIAERWVRQLSPENVPKDGQIQAQIQFARRL